MPTGLGLSLGLSRGTDPLATGRQVAESATHWYDTRASGNTAQLLDNLGTGSDPAHRGSVSAAGILSNGLYLPGTVSNNASTPDSASVSITGDIDIRLKLTEHVEVANSYYAGHLTGASNLGWRLGRSASGVYFQWTADGSTLETSVTATGLSLSAGEWLRATMDVDDGASQHVVTIYTSADGETWTQEQQVTRAGTTSIFDSSDAVYVGSGYGGSGLSSNATIEAFELRDGIGGTLVASPNFALQAPGTTSFDDDEGNTWTINSTGSDTNDPTQLEWSGTDYVWFPPVAGNAISFSSHGSWTTGWAKAIGRMRVRIPAQTTSGRLWKMKYLGWLQTDSSGNVHGQYRHTSAGFSSAIGTQAVPWTADELIDVALVLDHTNQQLEAYWRVAPSTLLRDDAVDDFTGWTKFIDYDTSGLPIDNTYSGVNYIGSNGTANLHGNYDFFEGQFDFDGDLVEWTPANPGSITRASSDLKITNVTRDVDVFDGTDDYWQLPASATPTVTATTGECTIAALARMHNTTTDRRLFSSESAAGNGLFLTPRSSLRQFQVRLGGASATTSVVSPGSWTDGELWVGAGVVDDGSLYSYLDTGGISAAGSTTTNGTVTHNATARVGSYPFTVSSAFEGEVFAALVFDRALTETELDDLAAYLQSASL